MYPRVVGMPVHFRNENTHVFAAISMAFDHVDDEPAAPVGRGTPHADRAACTGSKKLVEGGRWSSQTQKKELQNENTHR